MFETRRERCPNKLWCRREYEQEGATGCVNHSRAMSVIAIAMGRCAAGTQQVLVPCSYLLQLKIQGRLGQSRSEVQVHSW